MNLPNDITADGCAFSIRARYESCYASNLGNGGALPDYRGHCHIWPTITAHYHKECWSNFLGGGSSLMLAPSVIVIYELGGANVLD